MESLAQLEVSNLFNFKGWIAVVTGGGTGLGLMTAHALAANGVKVYITGRRVEKLKEAELQHASGGSIIALPMDVASKESICDAVRQIEEKEQYVNFLVNNAGVSSPEYGPHGMPQGDVRAVSKALMESHGFDTWTSVYQVNVAAQFFTSVGFLPLLCAARDHGFPESGSILNISSISGITKDTQNGQFAYNASKAASIKLTELLAQDLKRPDLMVRVNNLAPGFFPSEMVGVGRDFGREQEHFRKRWEIPFGRSGNARDYAQAVLNFAANQYVTGTTLVIDGAWLLVHA